MMNTIAFIPRHITDTFFMRMYIVYTIIHHVNVYNASVYQTVEDSDFR